MTPHEPVLSEEELIEALNRIALADNRYSYEMSETDRAHSAVLASHRALAEQHATLTARCLELQNDCQWAHEEFKSYIEFRLADRFEGDDAMIQRALGQSALYARLTIWLNKQALATGAGRGHEDVSL